MKSDFIHLHVHSDYSLLDGACKISALMQRAGALGMDTLARNPSLDSFTCAV